MKAEISARAMVVVAMCCWGSGHSKAAELDAGSRDKIVAGYVASWKELQITASVGEKLTHLIYAFGSVSPDGLARLADPCLDVGQCDGESSTSPGGNFKRLESLKRELPSLRILISFGGWTGSAYISDVAATPSDRERFAASIIDVFFRPYPGIFDGVDIDWEYPVEGGAEGNRHRPQDKDNFALLMSEIRRQLSVLSTIDGRRYELTMAISADATAAKNLDLVRLAADVNWIGVMAYDYYAGTPVAGFNAPLFRSDGDMPPSTGVASSVSQLLAAGVPAGKLVLGIPFYGRAYGDVSNENSSGHGIPDANWGGEDGIDYKDIVRRQPESLGFVRHWDEKAQVPWLYNAQQRIWISYDDATSIARKADYARSAGIAGVMIWELGGDDGTLLPEVVRGIKGR
jgi:chitinase